MNIYKIIFLFMKMNQFFINIYPNKNMEKNILEKI